MTMAETANYAEIIGILTGRINELEKNNPRIAVLESKCDELAAICAWQNEAIKQCREADSSKAKFVKLAEKALFSLFNPK